MSCNTCAKSFSLFRKEKGCPSCGFAYCSNCLNNVCFVPKLSKQTKVCVKCKMSDQKPTAVEPPSTYLKRLENTENPPIIVYKSDDKARNLKRGLSKEDQKIIDRLIKLNEGEVASTSLPTDEEIEDRLKRLRGFNEERVTVTDAEMAERLAKLKGECFIPNTKSSIPSVDHRTDEEKAEELMLKYMTECAIDDSKDRAFQETDSKMEKRLTKLQGHNKDNSASGSEVKEVQTTKSSMSADGELQTIIKQCLSEPTTEDDDEGLTKACTANTADELPWCEICNEDADFRCLGCRELFCKECFKEHLDDDLGCDKGEPYKKKQSLCI